MLGQVDKLAVEHGQRLSSSASTFWAGPFAEMKYLIIVLTNS